MKTFNFTYQWSFLKKLLLFPIEIQNSNADFNQFYQTRAIVGGEGGNFQGYVKLNTSFIPQRMTAVCWINFHNYGSIPFSSEANLNFPLNCKDRSNHNNFSGSPYF